MQLLCTSVNKLKHLLYAFVLILLLTIYPVAKYCHQRANMVHWEIVCQKTYCDNGYLCFHISWMISTLCDFGYFVSSKKHVLCGWKIYVKQIISVLVWFLPKPILSTQHDFMPPPLCAWNIICFLVFFCYHSTHNKNNARVLQWPYTTTWPEYGRLIHHHFSKLFSSRLSNRLYYTSMS